jgi:hypothetical protein
LNLRHYNAVGDDNACEYYVQVYVDESGIHYTFGWAVLVDPGCPCMESALEAKL